jgi:hypothetical protein
MTILQTPNETYYIYLHQWHKDQAQDCDIYISNGDVQASHKNSSSERLFAIHNLNKLLLSSMTLFEEYYYIE